MAEMRTLVVGTMCHCDEHGDDPNDCAGHWELFFDPEMGHDGVHVGRGKLPDASDLHTLASLWNVAQGAVGKWQRMKSMGTDDERLCLIANGIMHDLERILAGGDAR